MFVILTIAFILFLLFHPIGNVLLGMIVSVLCLVFELLWAALVICLGAIVFIICLPLTIFKSK